MADEEKCPARQPETNVMASILAQFRDEVVEAQQAQQEALLAAVERKREALASGNPVPDDKSPV